MQQLQLVKTGDGSHTLYNSALNEHYHSTHGAVNEALHVFIQHGLGCCIAVPINILEIGFGTGLNALLTYHYALQNNMTVNYHSIELHPLNMDMVAGLNYPALLGAEYSALFKAIHKADWNTPTPLHPSFLMHKIAGSIHTYPFYSSFDVVYFDAFAPDKQPDMWTQAVFEGIYRLMNPQGLLVTYCAKGVVKRTLKAAGFTIETLPGPPGKREMTRAIRI